MDKKEFVSGIKDGLPIGLGYFPVAFSFGVQASLLSVPVLISLFISMTNLTSAGQLAGLTIVATLGSFLEIIVTELVINSRYFLMSLTLSQKLDEGFDTKKRLFYSAFITDEIFAVASSKEKVNKSFFFGLIILPYIGWALGTLFGALAGNILPSFIVSALGIALYAMFIAIIVPPAMKSLGVVVAIALSVAISCAIYYLPFLKVISSGFAIIISSIVASLITALIFPVKDEKEKGDE